MPPYNNQPDQRDSDSPSLPNPVGPVPPHQPTYHPGPTPSQPQPQFGNSGVPQLRPQEISQDFPSSPQDENPDRYAFFMESKPKPKNPLIAGAKSASTFTLVIAGAAGLVAILIIAAILMSAFRDKGNDTSATLSSVIHQQQEIIRVTKLATTNVQDSDLVNLVATTNISMTSSQQQFIDYGNAHGVKIKAKDLAKYVANPKTDDELNAAAAASTYDSTFSQVMNGLLTDYQSSLDKLSAQAVNSPNEKNLADQTSEGVTLLKKMLTEQ